MNKIEFVDEIKDRTTQIAAHFAKDHQYVMLLATVEHKLDEAQVTHVAAEYLSRPQAERDVVVFTAWDCGVKIGKFEQAVELRLESKANQKRAKEGGMRIRDELNDDIFAEFIESSQNYHNAIKYYNDRIDEGTSRALDKEKKKEANAVIQGLYSEFNRLFGV